MTNEKSFYYAGAVALVLGITPQTLRMWRDRDLCHLGAVEDGAEDNPRSRRRYQVMDMCLIAIAMGLARSGFSLEEAFNIACNRPDVRDAATHVIVNDGHPDLILSTVGSDDGEERAARWANTVALLAPEWKAKISGAFDAVEPIDSLDAEFVMSLNVSAIARRVMKRLTEIEAEVV